MLLEVGDDSVIVHIASDEEGNSYGNVSKYLMKAIIKETGKKVVVLFPQDYYEDDTYEDEEQQNK